MVDRIQTVFLDHSLNDIVCPFLDLVLLEYMSVWLPGEAETFVSKYIPGVHHPQSISERSIGA